MSQKLPVYSEEKASELFEDCFSSNSGGIIRDCCCGRVHFEYLERGGWEEGELEDLLKKAEENPEKYIACDYSVSTMIIDGKEIVYGCPCNAAKRYENFIVNYARQIAQFLNERGEKLLEDAEIERKMTNIKNY